MAAQKLQMQPVPATTGPKIRTMWNYKPKAGWKRPKGSKSLFVPAQAFTPRQIADRFANGLHTLVDRVALYDNGTEVIKNFDKLDLTEKQAILKRVETEILRKRHEAQVEAKKKHEAVFQKAVLEEIKRREEAAANGGTPQKTEEKPK